MKLYFSLLMIGSLVEGSAFAADSCQRYNTEKVRIVVENCRAVEGRKNARSEHERAHLNCDMGLVRSSGRYENVDRALKLFDKKVITHTLNKYSSKEEKQAAISYVKYENRKHGFADRVDDVLAYLPLVGANSYSVVNVFGYKKPNMLNDRPLQIPAQGKICLKRHGHATDLDEEIMLAASKELKARSEGEVTVPAAVDSTTAVAQTKVKKPLFSKPAKAEKKEILAKPVVEKPVVQEKQTIDPKPDVAPEAPAGGRT